MIIRKANTHDSSAVCRISCESLGYDCTVELVSARLNNIDGNREIVFVADLGESTVGYIHAEIYNLIYCESMVNILGIAVDTAYRRHGIGKTLLSAVEDWAKSLGVHKIRLNSGTMRSEAHTFYRAMGYNNQKNQIRFIKDLD